MEERETGERRERERGRRRGKKKTRVRHTPKKKPKYSCTSCRKKPKYSCISCSKKFMSFHFELNFVTVIKIVSCVVLYIVVKFGDH